MHVPACVNNVHFVNISKVGLLKAHSQQLLHSNSQYDGVYDSLIVFTCAIPDCH